MSVQLWTTGPVNVFLMAGQSNQIYPFGFGTVGPDIREYQNWEDRKSDIGGTRVPDDISFQRPFHIISVNLERWDGAVLQLFRDPNFWFTGAAGASGPGTYPANMVGALAVRQQLTFGLILQFPNFVLPQYGAAVGGLQGYWFFYSQWEGPQNFPTGTRDNNAQMTIRNIGRLATIGGANVWQHYTNTLPPLPVVPVA